MSDVYTELFLRRQELALLEREAELRRHCGIAFYEPHYKQHLFHAAGEYKRRFLRTGNRFGKTTAGCAETCAYLLGERPWYRRSFDIRDQDGTLRHHHDPALEPELITHGLPTYAVKGILIVVDWAKCAEIFTDEVSGKLWKFLPKDSVTSIGRTHGKITEIYVRSIHGGTSVLYIDTIESWRRNNLSQESSDWDFAHLDEPLPEKMWKSIARGLVDRDGSAHFCCTPLTELWINDRFDGTGSIREDHPDGFVDTRDIDGTPIKTWMLTGSMHDNIHFGTLQKSRYIAELSEDERETRIDGRPAQLVGVVYKEFKPDVHIYRSVPVGWKEFDQPPDNYTIRVAVDTHPRTPTAVLFTATAPSGRVFVYDEIFEQGLLIPQVCELIRFKLRGRTPHRFLLELAAYTEDPIDGYTIADVFMDHQFPIEKAPRDLSFGILEVKSALLDRDRGHPTLLFSSLLRETHREFDRYVWDDKTARPRDADDHMMECLYRLVISDLQYIDPNKHEAPVSYLNATKLDLRLPGEAPRKNSQYKESRYRAGKSPEQNWQENDCMDFDPEYQRLARNLR